MQDLTDEIKEDIQREKYGKLWKDYGWHIIVAAVGVVLITAGFVGWKNYNIAKYEEAGTSLYEDSLVENTADSTKITASYEKTFKNGEGEYAAIAGLRQAYFLTGEGKKDQAIKIYKDIKERTDIPEEFKGLAAVLYRYLSDENDNGAKETVVFEHSLKEFAAFEAYEKGDEKKAKEIFEKLFQDKNTPSGIKRRSSEMMQVFSKTSNTQQVK